MKSKLLLSIFTIMQTSFSAYSQTAFPCAENFGAKAIGGRGGKLFLSPTPE